MIHDVFEVPEAVLKTHGGEILKFMGDGVLAVFMEPTVNIVKEVPQINAGMICCHRELLMFAPWRKRLLKEMSDERVARKSLGVEVGIGLHYGDCSYGNVGAESRLDFTVIGLSLIVASRVEGLCSSLGASVLATEEFVQRDPSISGWTFRGKHSSKGVAGVTPVYELMIEHYSAKRKTKTGRLR